MLGFKKSLVLLAAALALPAAAQDAYVVGLTGALTGPPSSTYAPAVDALEHTRGNLRACGISDSRAMDAWIAIIGGLAAQQASNEPGGDRWLRLVDDVTDMYLAHYAAIHARKAAR